MKKFSAKIIEKLKYYVYLYIDPRDEHVFYIGKGQANRAFSHLNSKGETAKAELIAKIRKAGMEPRIELLKYGLREQQALLVEATAIDLLDVTKLTNVVRGHGIKYGARAGVDEIRSRLDAKPVEITEHAILINISRAYRYGMTPMELYDATRSSWRVGPNRDAAEFAFAIYRGNVREVYEISAWLPGGSTIRNDDGCGIRGSGEARWEFVGVLADEVLRQKYIGKSVRDYFPAGAQNPIMYVNC